MLFHAGASLAGDRPLVLGALVQHVLLGQPLARTVSRESVGMNVLPPVDPGSSPGSVVDKYYVRAPVEAAISPAPRAKEIANTFLLASS